MLRQRRLWRRSILGRRSLRWKLDGCEGGTAVDSVASSGEMAQRFYMKSCSMNVFETAEMQIARLHMQDWSGLLETVNLQFSRRLSCEMWATGLEECCAHMRSKRIHYARSCRSRSCQDMQSCCFKLAGFEVPQGVEQTRA